MLPEASSVPTPTPAKRMLGRAKKPWQQNRLPEDLRAVIVHDRNTLVGRKIHEYRVATVAELGGNLTSLERSALEGCCQLLARILPMDASYAETGTMSEHASRTYLAWRGALNRHERDLRALVASRGKKSSTATIAELNALADDASDG
jgi:hypothetical protein